MKPAPFDYVAPTTVEAACAALAEADGGAQVLAGGQTLMPLMALRMSQPFVLVDINRIGGLTGISHTGQATRIGALTRQNEVIGSDELASRLPVLVQAVRHVGHLQTRNRGTVGGSIAFGEPAAELPATVVALGATIEVQSVRGVRKIEAKDLYLGPYATIIEPDELLTAVYFPDWPVGTAPIFREVTRRPGDFALVGLVGALVAENGRISRCGLAWFGMGDTPILARQAQEALIGQEIGEVDTKKAADFALADCEPFDDHHATAQYRASVGRRIFEQALQAALETVSNR